MSTKNFYTNDAIYLRFELNYYTEIVVDLNKVQFLSLAIIHRAYVHVKRERSSEREGRRERAATLEGITVKNNASKKRDIMEKIGSYMAKCNKYT